MMKHRSSWLIIFTALLAALAGAPTLKKAYAESTPVTLGTFTPPPIVFEETGSYVKLNNSAFVVEFYKASAGYNKIYNESGAVVVYDERHFLEYWRTQGGGSWSPRGVPYNLTWVKVSDYWYNVTRHYTDYLGTDWNVTFVVKSWEPIKSAVSVDSGQTDTYRISWELSGVVYTDEVNESNSAQFGSGRLVFNWTDVYENFGNISTPSVESHAQGRKLTVSFAVGEIAAGALLVLDPTIDGSTTSIASATTYQRKIVYDGTYWWLFYHNGTGWKYKYSSDLSTISGGATVEDVGTGGRAGGLSATYDSSRDAIQTFYGYYSGNYKLKQRFGSISGTTINWNASTFLLQDGSYYVGQGSVYDKEGARSWVAIHKYSSNDVTRWRYTTFWSSDVIDGSEPINSNRGGIAMVDTTDGIFNVLQDGSSNLRYSTDSNNFAAIGGGIVTAGGHAAFSMVSEGNVVHLAYLDSSNNLEYIRWNGTGWGSVETIMASAPNAYCFPVISLDDGNGELYVFWGDDTVNDIYYRKRDSTGVSGTWDTSSTTLVDETALVGGNKWGNGALTAPLYFNNSQIPVMYTTGSSPYTVKIASVSLNSDPTITSASSPDLKDTDNMYGMDGYYSFSVVVNDADGATDIDKVYLQAKSGETVRWEVRATSLTGTPSFSIQTGSGIIDQSGSTWSEDGNAGTATFEVRAEFDHPGLADLELAVYVEDASAASAGFTDMQTDYFDVINRLVTDSFAVSDSRHSTGGTVTFSGNVRYSTTVSGDTASSYYPADGLFTGVDIHDSTHSIKANDLSIVNGAFSTSSAFIPSLPTLTNYHVYLNLAPDFTDMDAPDGDTVAVISDRVEVQSYSVADSRININDNVELNVTLQYEYDGSEVTDGTITMNGESASHLGGGIWQTTASKSTVQLIAFNNVQASGNEHGITSENQNSQVQNVIWDRIQLAASSVSDARCDINDEEYFEATLIYDYDNALVTDGTLTIEAASAVHQGSGVWRVTMTKSVVIQIYYNVMVPAGNAHAITTVDWNSKEKYITWDRLEPHSFAVDDSNIDIGGAAFELRFQMRYDYDSVAFEGTDGSISGWTWDSGNGWWDKAMTGASGSQSTNYDESDIGAVTDSNYGITAIKNVGGVNVITDFIELHIVQLQDSRIDVSGSSEVNYVLRYYYYAQEITDSDASIVGYTYDGVNSWWEKALTGSSSVGSENFDENDLGAITDNNYGLTVYEDVAGVNLITDRVEIYYEAVDDSLVLKDENIEYRIKARLDYDNHELGSGDTATANSGAMAWDAGNGWFDDQRSQATVGSYEFDVTAASEATYGISALWEPQSSPTGYWKDTPGNDAADSDATYDVDVYGWVNVTVTDEDGVANLATVDIQMTTSGSEVFTLRWTQSSGVFSEQSDASGVCTLDVSGSARVNVDADTDKIAFRFKVSAGAQMGAVSVQVTSTDDDGYSDQDNYGSEFSINWYAEITIDDGSHSWSSLSPGDTDQALPGDGDIDITVSSNGAFDLQGKVSAAPTSGSYTIPLSNLKIHEDTMGSASALTTGYVDIGGLTSQSRGLSLAKSFKLWLTVPNPQQDGSYTYTLSLQVTAP